MKSIKTIEFDKCDFCVSDEGCYNKCLGCGKDVCYDCCKTVGVRYESGVHSSGSGDGFYCHQCDQLPAKTPIHSAYQEIRSLRMEGEGFYKDLRRRAEEVEERLRRLLGKK